MGHPRMPTQNTASDGFPADRSHPRREDSRPLPCWSGCRTNMSRSPKSKAGDSPIWLLASRPSRTVRLAWWPRERRPETIRLVPGDQECMSCARNARADLPARERIYVGPRWRVAHAFGTSLPGWLVLVPRRHTVALDDLTVDEAADLGPLLKAVSSALRDVVRCRKTYVALFAEAEGFQHVHFHIIPRQPGLEADLRGPRVFGLMGGDPASYVPEDVMDEMAGRLSQALHREL